jgi:hypothetical protein
MGDFSKRSPDLVRMLRLALSGRTQDVRSFALSLSRKYRKADPSLASALSDLLSENPTPQMPTRGASVAAVPVDLDSRLQLAKFDAEPPIDDQPVWATEVDSLLGQIVAEHQRGAELLAAGLTPTRTAVFSGPPGVGKTLAAKWLAVRMGRPLITLDLSAVISSYLGRTGSNVRNVLDYAKGIECVLLLDEIDALAKRRDDAHEVGELKRLVTVLLQEVDDWPAGGLLIAATNHPELLDPAIWRRFEILVDFPMPDRSTSQSVIKTYLGADGASDEKWVDVLVIALSGCSFSDIEREIKAAKKRSIIHDQPLETALEQIVAKRTAELPKAALKDLALKLESVGVSQHQIRRLTGLSRDTIRANSKDSKV